MTGAVVVAPEAAPGQDGSRITVLSVVLIALSAVSGILFGYDTGVVSGAMLLIRPVMRLDDLWHELIVSGTIASAWAFSLCGGVMTDRFGRRSTILAAAMFFTAGALIMGLATDKEMLLAGRIVIGVGVGLASMSTPVYIAESTAPRFRGVLVMVYTLGTTGGQFIAGVISGALSGVTDGWRLMLGLAGVPSVVLLVGFLFLPESPRWLVARGRFDEAEDVLRRLRGPDANVLEELKGIRENCEEQERIQKASVKRNTLMQIWHTRHARRALLVGCLLQTYQQLCGINTVMYYSASIIKMAGVGDNSMAIWLSAGVASVNFIFTPVGMSLVDRIGRRMLAIASLLGAAVSLMILGGSFLLMDSDAPSVTDANSLGDACSSLTSCTDCVSTHHMCGFCFSDESPFSASCWPRDNITDAALGGACAAAAPGLTWAVGYCPSHYSWIAVLALVLYLVCFSPGMGAVPWVVNSEIHPIWARDVSTSITTSTNWLFNLIVSLTFLTLVDAISAAGTFFLIAGITLTGVVLLYFLLPETKGVSLEEMEAKFGGRTPESKSSSQNHLTPSDTAQT